MMVNGRGGGDRTLVSGFVRWKKSWSRRWELNPDGSVLQTVTMPTLSRRRDVSCELVE